MGAWSADEQAGGRRRGSLTCWCRAVLLCQGCSSPPAQPRAASPALTQKAVGSSLHSSAAAVAAGSGDARLARLPLRLRALPLRPRLRPRLRLRLRLPRARAPKGWRAPLIVALAPGQTERLPRDTATLWQRLHPPRVQARGPVARLSRPRGYTHARLLSWLSVHEACGAPRHPLPSLLFCCCTGAPAPTPPHQAVGLAPAASRVACGRGWLPAYRVCLRRVFSADAFYTWRSHDLFRRRKGRQQGGKGDSSTCAPWVSFRRGLHNQQSIPRFQAGGGGNQR